MKVLPWIKTLPKALNQKNARPSDLFSVSNSLRLMAAGMVVSDEKSDCESTASDDSFFKDVWKFYKIFERQRKAKDEAIEFDPELDTTDEGLSMDKVSTQDLRSEDEDESKGKDENLKENANDSGLGISGIAINTQSKKSDCNLPKINSTSSTPSDEASSTEWRPLRPKWHCKEDPNYFHCHQDSPELCEKCSMQWGHPIFLGMKWDGEGWV